MDGVVGMAHKYRKYSHALRVPKLQATQAITPWQSTSPPRPLSWRRPFALQGTTATSSWRCGASFSNLDPGESWADSHPGRCGSSFSNLDPGESAQASYPPWICLVACRTSSPRDGRTA